MGRKGWGAYSIEAIQKGAFVADYTGEMLPAEEARKRMPNYDRDGSNYVLSTQEFFQGVRVSMCTVCVASSVGPYYGYHIKRGWALECCLRPELFHSSCESELQVIFLKIFRPPSVRFWVIGCPC